MLRITQYLDINPRLIPMLDPDWDDRFDDVVACRKSIRNSGSIGFLPLKLDACADFNDFYCPHLDQSKNGRIKPRQRWSEAPATTQQTVYEAKQRLKQVEKEKIAEIEWKEVAPIKNDPSVWDTPPHVTMAARHAEFLLSKGDLIGYRSAIQEIREALGIIS